MPSKNFRPNETNLEARADELTRLAADPNLIAGIYNYCDRWCERCPQTARCLNFQMGRARDKRRGREVSTDAKNAEFWDELGKNFALALHMVRREARKQGIDLDAPAAEAAAAMEARSRRRRVASEGAAVLHSASSYRKAAQKLLERLPAELRATEEALNAQIRLAVGNPHGAAKDIHDALEVVSWYLYFIEVKLTRAVAGRVDEQIEGDDGFPRDSDGSAKTALIAIDRSLAAWLRLREQFGAEKDSILDLLVQLDCLRRAVEEEFPCARAFQRNGLD